MMTTKAERWANVLAALLERADHPSTPPAEAELARAKAQHLAAKYSIDLPEINSKNAIETIAPPDGNYTGSFLTGPYAVNCHCAVFSPLDPSGTYGAPPVGWTVQAPSSAILKCPAHAMHQLAAEQDKILGELLIAD